MACVRIQEAHLKKRAETNLCSLLLYSRLYSGCGWRFFFLFRLTIIRPLENYFSFGVHDDLHGISIVEFAAQQLIRKRVFHLLLDDPAQRTCSKLCIVAEFSKFCECSGSGCKRKVMSNKPLCHLVQLEADDFLDVFLVQ